MTQNMKLIKTDEKHKKKTENINKTNIQTPHIYTRAQTVTNKTHPLNTEQNNHTHRTKQSQTQEMSRHKTRSSVQCTDKQVESEFCVFSFSITTNNRSRTHTTW